MRAFSIAIIAVILLISRAASPAPKKALSELLPPAINGVAMLKMPADMAPPPPDVAAAYLDRKTGKSININLFRVKDLKTSKAQFHHLKAGETKESAGAHLSFKGFEAGGFSGERTRYLGNSKKSEAILLLGDKLDVRVSVQPTDNEDEAIEILKQLDLAELNTFAKTMK